MQNFHGNMILSVWRILFMCGPLLWKVLCSDARRFIEEGNEFSLNCSHVNSSGTPTWSRDHRGLPKLVGNLSYHVNNASLNDSGIYNCTRSGVTQVFEVEVGRRPTIHSPVCFNSPNLTIACTTAVAGGTLNTTVCLEVYKLCLGKVGKECNEGNATFNLHLQESLCGTFNFITIATNPFGKRKRTDQFSELDNKVIPQPPINVEMNPDGVDSFNVSFTIPPPWNKHNMLHYSYVFVQDNLPPYHGEQGRLESVPFKIHVRPKPFSLVCLKIRMKYLYSQFWGEYSLPKCQRTPEAAPSSGPSSVNVTSVPDKLHADYRTVTVTWEPPDEQNRNGVIYQYSVTLERQTVDNNYEVYLSALVNGSVTQCTLPGIPSYETININVKAWTKMGASPVSTYTLYAVSKTGDERNTVLWITVGFSCLAIFLVSVKVFFLLRHKFLSKHLPEPFFIHPSKIPTFQSSPPQREVFDSLNQRPGSLQQANPHPGKLQAPSSSHSGGTFRQENSGRNAFTGTDSGISCDTDNSAINQTCRCSDLTNRRDNESVVQVCTYTGLPNDTSVLQCKESELHQREERAFSKECPDEVQGCIFTHLINDSHSGYKHPRPPRVLGNDKWEYVPMCGGKTEQSFQLTILDKCCVTKTDMEDERYIAMTSNVPIHGRIKGNNMELVAQQSSCKKQEKLSKEDLLREGKLMNAGRSVQTLQGSLADDEFDLTKLGLKDFVQDNSQALRSCQSLEQIDKKESTVKNVEDASSTSTNCINTFSEKRFNRVFTDDHELNFRVQFTSSRPASQIERDSGYTSDN